jgi:hypothetical protein
MMQRRGGVAVHWRGCRVPDLASVGSRVAKLLPCTVGVPQRQHERILL